MYIENTVSYTVGFLFILKMLTAEDRQLEKVDTRCPREFQALSLS